MPTATEKRNVLVFGAGGKSIGNYIMKALLADGRFNVSIVTRKTSKSTFPPQANVIALDDSMPHADLVDAMKDQEVVIAAVGPASLDLERNLIDAAIEAGVKRFIPSEYGINNLHPKSREVSPIFDTKGAILEYLISKEHTGLTWTAVPTGLWLDWALDPATAFAGVNVKTQTATLWDNGGHALSWSTLPWAAEAVVTVLLHQSETTNKVVPVRAFNASQLDLIHILEGIQGVRYRISHQDGAEMIRQAREQYKAGDSNAALVLLRASLFLDGYGSNFVEEGIVPIGNDFLPLRKIEIEDVIRSVIKA